MPEKWEDDERAAVVSIRLHRLAAPRPGDETALPSFADVGVADLVAEASRWQFLRAGAWFWEFAAGPLAHQADRWQEIGGLFGSAGEVANLAAGAAVEIELLQRGIRDGQIDESYGMAVRFFAEAQGNLLISAAHKMAYIGWRALMLGRDYPFGVSVENKRLRQPAPAFSDLRSHWIGVGEAGTAGQDRRRLGA